MTKAAQEAFSQTNFGAFDWVIVGVYLLISVAIGLYVKRYVSDMATYIGAGRKVGTWLGVATMTGTELGLITVMFMAQKGFGGGFAAFHMALIAGVATLFVGLTGFIVVPLRKLEVLTIPEYYEKRFSRGIRVLGGIMLAFAGILNMGLFLKVGSMFLVGITGLSSEGDALKIVMVVLLVLVLVYTTMGGMISVILTDYIQFVVLAFGLLMATGIAIASLGWDHIFVTISEQMGEGGFNPAVEESGFGWEYILWMTVTAGLVGSAVWPTAVARALAMESTKALRRQYMWSSVSFTVRFMLPMFWGICAFVYVVASPEGADLKTLFFPPEGSGVEAMDNLYAMPLFMGRLMPPVMVGVIASAMIAAFMSTHDSYFLCWSSVITQDVVAPLRGENLSTAARVRLTRIVIVLIGAYVLYWGMFYKGKEDIWDYMAVSGGIFFTGAFVVLVLGIYWKGASSFGALLGLLSGFLMLFGLDPVQRRVGLKYVDAAGETVERLSSAQLGLLVVVIAFVLMVVGSLLVPGKVTGKEDS
jgi:SSS family solute:Na+ symporter